MIKEKTKEDLISILKSMGYNVISKDDEDFDWRDLLEKTSKGNIKPTYENHKIVFENVIKGDLQFNEFERVIEYNGKVIDNTTVSILRNQFEREGKFRSKEVMRDFLSQYSYEHKYNPIKDYLENLEWDGIPRVSKVFIDWFGVEDNEVNRKLSEKWFVSGVKRIYEPGCLIEGMIVLVGSQGIGKSTFIKRLGKHKYTTEVIVDLRNEKNCVEIFNRSWIVNFDELKSLVKSDNELIKSVLTRQSDICRLSYREESETYDRHCVFIGSTNDTSILKDYSDRIERRFWMMKCNQTDKRHIFNNFTDEIVDQIWGEVYHIYKNNPNYNISISDFSDDELDMIYNIQRDFKSFNGDDLSEELMEILDGDYFLNENGEFKNKQDFVDQVLGKKDNDTCHLFSRINVIPFSYINHYLNSTRNPRPNKYIIESLSDSWMDVPKYNYRGSRLHCLVRKDMV